MVKAVTRIGKISLVVDQDKGGGDCAKRDIEAIDLRNNWREAAKDREKEMEKNLSNDFCYTISRQNDILINTLTLLTFDIGGFIHFR